MRLGLKSWCEDPEISIDLLTDFLEKDKVRGFGKILYLGRDSYIKEMYIREEYGKYLIEFDTGYMVKYKCPPDKMHEVIKGKNDGNKTNLEKRIQRVHTKAKTFVHKNHAAIKQAVLTKETPCGASLVVLTGWDTSVGVPHKDVVI